MKLAYIRWKDALAVEADDQPATHVLAELEEVGFYIGEGPEGVTIALEHQHGAVRPGRWRLTVPKVNIIELVIVPLSRVFNKPRKPRTRKPIPVVVVSGDVLPGVVPTASVPGS